ncbi:UvrD-helicase domain-containing protein [Enterococcus canintestini]|uniref:HelD family protein n=1 Tax=Enterococcus canintestini TaxID=317010 RepID=UPI00288CC826|nr:UvrD-helicase domain-containing protein [Enterococcus canintestini]MDT2739235.1 AAA family ATPase [Enterococcus canintestini]
MYLKKVYHALQQEQEKLTETLAHGQSAGIAALQEMAQDVRLNFDNFADNLDTYAQLEMKNREIDQLNLKQETAANRLAQVERLLPQAYFGKVAVDYFDNEKSQPFYIGINGFSSENENLVYDWRSPIAELFYNNVLGKSHYLANGAEIFVSIDLRRQFVIAYDQLKHYFDTNIAIEDDVLLAALENSATEQMQAITATIQQEQNVIIRDLAAEIILVNGVAGSGKTSTIMQRIAYLLYSFRQQISADDVLILSPNDKFIQYLSHVLPALGEKNPRNLTWRKLLVWQLDKELETESDYFERITKNDVSDQTEILRSRKFAEFVASGSSILQQGNYFQAITLKKKVIIKAELLAEMFATTPPEASFGERLQGVAAKLNSYWQRRLLKQAQKKAWQDRLLALSETQQQKYFGHLLQDESPKTLQKYTHKLLQQKFAAVTAQIADFSWLQPEKMLADLYQAYTNETYLAAKVMTVDEATIALFIQHRFIQASPLSRMQYVLVDEVQDYTPAQIFLLSQLFKASRFTLVGDSNQAIFNTNTDFATIAAIFETSKRQVTRYDLLNSYRSSGAITAVFQQLAAQENFTIVPVRPKGKAVTVKHLAELSDLRNIINEMKPVTIITKTQKEADDLTKWWQGQNAALKKEAKARAEVTILPISLAKGLEFDRVILYNTTKENYANDRERKMLYTAASRGMQELTITYFDGLTPYLKFLA